MGARGRSLSGTFRPGGRFAVAVRLPAPAAQELRQRADRAGRAPEEVAGSLISEALPVVAAAVAQRLAQGTGAVTPPASGGAATDISIVTGCTVALSVSPGGPVTGPPGDASA